MSTPDSSLTITASEIAQLAGVGRSTVSNWRQRHDDFPKPVDGDAASPRFLADEIRAWLKANDKKIKDLPADSAIWSAVDILRGTATLEDIGGLIGSLIAWRYISDADSEGFDETLPDDSRWRRVRNAVGSPELRHRIELGMHAYERSHPERAPLFGPFIEGRGAAVLDRMDPRGLHAMIDALSSFPASSIGKAFIAFHERLTTSARRGYDEWATSAALVDLVAAAAEGIPGPVHDPVAGSGRLLLAVSSRGGDRSAITGQDINAGACTQANQRALVTGRSKVTIRCGDVFQTDYFEKGLAQVVVMDPPYAMSYHDHGRLYLDPRLPYGPPPKSSMDAAWLQLALWYLAPGGRAFVLQPPASSFQGGPTGRVRTAMLQDGVVEAVVALPGGLASSTQIPLNLWVLGRPNQGSDPASVLLIDQSQTKNIDPDAVAAALNGWRERRAVPTSLPAGAFTVAEILAKDGVLSPQRWVSSNTETPEAKDVFTHVENLHSAVADIKPLSKLTKEAFIPGGQVPKLITVSDLAKAGEVVLLKANERVREGDYDTAGTPVVSGGWIRGIEKEPRRIDLSILEHPPVITEPGDVLVQNTGGLAARVDTVGGKVLLSPSFQLLRLRGNALRPEYLAEFLVTASNQRQSLGTTIQRIRVQDLKIPLLPLQNQDQAMERIGESRQLQAAARALLEAASTVRDSLVEGIASGVVEVADGDPVNG